MSTMVMIDACPTDNLSNIMCHVSFWFGVDDPCCSLNDHCYCRDSQIVSLVYHLLQSVNVYVSDPFFKGNPLCNIIGSSPTCA